MKFLKPEYYNEFKCVSSECKESCCIGWRVDVDKKSFNRYRKVPGEFGKKLKRYVSRNRHGDGLNHYAKINLENLRCPMLNSDGLCDLYINVGEDYLSNVCKTYPRVIDKYKNLCECNLTFSCSEVIKILLRYREPIQFTLEEYDFDEENTSFSLLNKYDDKLYDLLWAGRDFAIEIAQFREIKMWKRLVFIKLLQEKLQKIIDTDNYTYADVEKCINQLKESVVNPETIKSLDNIPKEMKVKTLFITAFSQAKVNKRSGISNRFTALLKEFNNIIDGSNSMEEAIERLKVVEDSFDIYIKDREYMLENYIVHSLFGEFMKVVGNKNLNSPITMMILEYALLKRLLMARWKRNDESLSDDDIIDVFYCFSKSIEHNPKFINEIYDNIKSAGYDTLAYLTILVR